MSWNAIDRTRKFALHQQNALVSFANLWNIPLHNNGFAVESREHFQHGAEILIAWLHAENTGTAISVERLQDDVVVVCAEGTNFFSIRSDEGRRHQILEQRHEKFFRCIAHMERIVNNQSLGMNAFEKVGGR